MSDQHIKIRKNGPYLVTGGIKLTQEIMVDNGGHREYRKGAELPQAESYALCRCGQSKNMPFCDGSHAKCDFDGTEVASRDDFAARAEVIDGPSLELLDDNRCAFARFCHRHSSDVWDLTRKSDDETLREEAIQAAMDCPAGRLVQRDKRSNREELEPVFDELEISLLEDSDEACSAPLYAKGGIPLQSADGTFYELRNRYTLCRCGLSANKPFCDARHVHVGYDDGLRRTNG